MAITTELVGTLGGGKVTEIPVNFTSPTETGTYDVITVPIPEGRPHRVIYIVNSTSVTTTAMSSFPEILIDGVSKVTFQKSTGVSVTSQSPIHIQIKRNAAGAYADPSHTGTVYYWPTS